MRIWEEFMPNTNFLTSLAPGASGLSVASGAAGGSASVPETAVDDPWMGTAAAAAGTAVGNKIGDKITSSKKHKEVDEACWDSHKQVGTKMKGGKQVPNCVPKNEAVNQDDHGEKTNQDKKDAAMKKTDQKKPFNKLRQETKLVRLGNNGKTDTGQKAAVIDLEPSARPI